MMHVEGQPHADEGIDRALGALLAAVADIGAFCAWRNHELADPGGRRYRVDVLVLALNGVWLLHMDRTSGNLTGDDAIWVWASGGRSRTVEAPFASLDATAQQVASALARVRPAKSRPVPVRSAVYLVGPVVLGAGLPQPVPLYHLSDGPDDGAAEVSPRLMAALRAPPDEPGDVLRPGEVDTIVKALSAAGFGPYRQYTVGGYKLEGLLEDGGGWQEHRAVHTSDPSRRARVRTWLVQRGQDAAQRAAFSRALRTESAVLARLGEHPNILGLIEHDHGDPPRLVFEGFDGLPLDKFLRARPQLSFDHRLDIVLAVGDALVHCHRHSVIHRNVSPASVLVAVDAAGRPVVRLHRFEAARAEASESTRIGTDDLSSFNARIDVLYRAPELASAPDAAAEEADVFSLGALAYFLFTNEHPGPTPRQRMERIRDDDGLHLWSARANVVHDGLDDLVSSATRMHPYERRFGGALLTVSRFLDTLRATFRKDDTSQPVDALLAAVGDVLISARGARFEVTRVLGTGATARVLEVKRDGVAFALKLPREPRHAPTLTSEGDALVRLDHPSIVRLEDRPTFGDTTGLLLQLAGPRTLAEHIRSDGTLSLDFCGRLGDQLLSAVDHLHARGVQHRDLKPANLSFSSIDHKGHHLLVFDLSLAGVPADRIDAGTDGWRDPFLGDTRTTWDLHADLYGAAACLHYALTGDRPTLSLRGDDAGTVRLTPSRFDASVRGALLAFFGRAFAARVTDRYPDALAMRDAWRAIFDVDVTTAVTESTDRDALIAQARPTTSISQLGLSVRAVDALERAGVFSVRDLCALPANRLSAVPAVGRDTAQRIHETRAELVRRLGDRDDLASTPFVGSLAGLPHDLTTAVLPLDDRARAVLRDAGLRSTHDLASLSEDAVVRLLGSSREQTEALRAALRATAPGLPLEGQIAAWVRELLRPNVPSKRTQWETRLGMLLGLEILPDDPFPLGGRTNAAAAAACGLPPATFRAAFQNIRARWDQMRPIADAAVAAVHEALQLPAEPLRVVAGRLLQKHAPLELRNDHDAERSAAAILRFATEVDLPEPPLSWRTIGGVPWVARHASTLVALAAAAQALDASVAARPLGPEDARALVLRAVEGTALAAVPVDTLLELVASASASTALSSRFEAHRRGLSAREAIQLATGVLQGALTPEDVHKRVRGRYPHGAELPTRPELDALMAEIGLVWSADRARYVRPGTDAGALTGTRAGTSSASTTASPDALVIERFDRDLRRSLEAGGFRVLFVPAALADRALDRLTESLPNLEVTSLDAAVIESLEAVVAARPGARLEPILDVERQGPTHPHWATLHRHFLTPAVQAVVDGVLERRSARPQLLIHPGLLARYAASDAIDRLVRTAADSGTGSVWLLLPAYEDGAAPRILHPLGDLPVPLTRAGQQLRVPRRWATA